MDIPFDRGRPGALPDSLWAAITPPMQELASFAGKRRVDVAVVGGGFMGLAAALHLAGKGARVAVLEAAQVGWGASGRNNGQVIAGLKKDPDEVRRILGAERGTRLLAFSGDAPGRVFDLIERYGIGCDATQRGWIQAVHSGRALPVVEARVRAWQDLGAAVAMIPEHDVSERLGTDFYPAAWLDPRGGSVNPLALVRGLARAALEAGVEIHTGSPAIGLERADDGWSVRTPRGELRCAQCLLCVNAYGGALRRLRGAVIPLRTAQVASAPLAPDRVHRILPRGEAASDTQRLLTSFRITPDHRLIMGGASATAGGHNPGLIRHLHLAAARRFPDLGAVPWQFGWSGYLALTGDHLPVIHRLGPGLYASVACNGRGLALAIAAGEELCALLNGGRESDCVVPVRPLRRQITFRLRHPGVAVAVLANRVMDRLERASALTHRHNPSGET